MDRIRTAADASVFEGILNAAMYSCTGFMIYRKWSRSEKKFVKKSYEVIPLDCGISRYDGKTIMLYAQDVKSSNKQVKMFKLNQIERFDKLKRRLRPSFEIQVKHMREIFNMKMEKQDEENAKAASIAVRIAQEIMEYSGAEANLFCDKKDPYSYNVVGDDGRGRTADLTGKQKKLTDGFAEKRKPGMEFGEFNYDSSGRYYVGLTRSANVVQPPDEIAEIIDKAGYWMPDYREGRLFKKDDREMKQQNAPDLLTVVKREVADEKDFERIKDMFEKRESGSNKRLDSVRLMMCITHNPYDIAGMSTDRAWTSCMRLPSELDEVTRRELKNVASGVYGSLKEINEKNKKNGISKYEWVENVSRKDVMNIYAEYAGLFGKQTVNADAIASKYGVPVLGVEDIARRMDRDLAAGGAYYSTALKQVEYGGLCAYLIREDDREIKKPLARIAVKRLENEVGDYIYKPESKIYGDAWLASSAGFADALKSELDKSNQTTGKGHGVFTRKDYSYSDGSINREYVGLSPEDYARIDYAELTRMVQDGRLKPSEEEVRKIIHLHKDKPSRMFMKAVAPMMSEKFRDDYAQYIDLDMMEADGSKDGDKPEDEEELASRIEDIMNDLKRGDDDGEVFNDGTDVVLEQYMALDTFYEMLVRPGYVPVEVGQAMTKAMTELIKDFYAASDDNDRYGYSTSAEMERDFFEGNMEYDVMDAFSQHISDYYYDHQAVINYRIEVRPVSGGVDEYELSSHVVYYWSDRNDGYEDYYASDMISVDRPGWSGRLKEFVVDGMKYYP